MVPTTGVIIASLGVLLLLPLVHAAAPVAAETLQASVSNGPLASFRLELTTPKKRYQQGEPIPIKMRYTYSGNEELAVNLTRMFNCRNAHVSFTVIGGNTDRVHDPALFKDCWSNSASSGLRPLTSKEPVDLEEFLNEWLFFQETGSYVVIARSSEVALSHPGFPWANDQLPAVESSPLTIEIVKPDTKQRATDIAAAANNLKDPHNNARQAAVRRLRFMNDPKTIPIMVKALEDTDYRVGDEARRGLMDFGDYQLVQQELIKVMLDKNHIVGPRAASAYFVPLLGTVDLRRKGVNLDTFIRELRARHVHDIPEFKHWKSAFKKIYEGKVSTLPPKRRIELIHQGIYYEYLSGKGIIDCKTMIRSPNLFNSAALRSCCGRTELSEGLVALAKDRTASDEVRNSALGILISTAPKAIDDSLRNSIADEVTSQRPRFAMFNAKQVLGEYKSKEIGRGLLTLFTNTTNREIRADAARRIQNYGAAISTRDLIGAFSLLESTGYMDPTYYAQRPLLEALAIRSSSDSLPIIRDIIRNRKPGDDRVGAISLLARIDLHLSRDLIAEILHSDDANDRRNLLWEQGQAWDVAIQKSRNLFTRQLQPSRRAIGYFIPEFISIYESDSRNRWQALIVLQKVTGIPAGRGIYIRGVDDLFGRKDASNLTIAESRSLPAQWKAWWRQNHSMFGR